VSEESVSTAPPRLNYAAAAGRAALLGIALTAAIAAPSIIRTGHLPHFPVGTLHAPNLALIGQASIAVKIHLVTLGIAACVGVILLSGIKGDRVHRTLGWIFAAAMLATGVVTLTIPPPPSGPTFFGFGPLHLFSLTALIGVPISLVAARNHKALVHGRIMFSLFVGGLGIAGLGAFTPGRLMWRMLFG
jgi:uncharacterized membrane protein